MTDARESLAAEIAFAAAETMALSATAIPSEARSGDSVMAVTAPDEFAVACTRFEGSVPIVVLVNNS